MTAQPDGQKTAIQKQESAVNMCFGTNYMEARDQKGLTAHKTHLSIG